MRNQNNVYDFNDFTQIVASKGNCIILEDFIDFPNGVSQAKYCSKKPHLTAIKVVAFPCNSVEMFWKGKYMQEDYFTNCILKKNTAKEKSEKKPFQKKSIQRTSFKKGWNSQILVSFSGRISTVFL